MAEDDGVAFDQTVPAQRRLHDPKILRAIAHPARSRILDELHASGPLRAADVARLLDVPANQASFHLRQLAKYGLVEPAPELAKDGRDRVWRTVPGALRFDDEELQNTPGAKAAHTLFMDQKAAFARLMVDRAFAPKKRTKDTVFVAVMDSLRLSKEEGEQFMTEVSELVDGWAKRTRGTDPHRRTYAFLSLVQPYPEDAGPS
jgi:DNA-binding transcriptional ArsR family regulator